MFVVLQNLLLHPLCLPLKSDMHRGLLIQSPIRSEILGYKAVILITIAFLIKMWGAMHLKRKNVIILFNTKGVGEGGQGARPPPHFQKWGAQVGFCAPPPPLLGRANVLISLFAHIVWLKTHFFQNFLGSLRSQT